MSRGPLLSSHLAYLLALLLMAAAVLVLARSENAALERTAHLEKTLESLDARALALEHDLLALTAADQTAEEGAGVAAKLHEQLQGTREALYLSRFEQARLAIELGREDQAAAALYGAPPEEHGWEWTYLTERLEGAARRVGGHNAPATALVASPDGRSLYSGAADGTVKRLALTRSATGALEADTLATSVVALPDGEEVTALACLVGQESTAAAGDRGLAVGGDFGALVWIPAEPEEAQSSTELDARVTALAAFETEAQEVVIVAGCADGSLHRWTPRSQALEALPGHENTVNVLRLSSDGELLASASDDMTVLLTSMRPGTADEQRVLENHTDWVRGLAFDATGERLASVGDDGRLIVVDFASEESRVVVEGAEALVHAAFDTDGAPFAISDSGLVVRGGGASGFTLPLDQDGIVLAAATGFHEAAGSSWIAYLDGGNSPLLHTGERGDRPVHSARVEGSVRSLALGEFGALVAAGTTQGDVYLLSSSATGWDSALLSGHTRFVRALAFSPDETVLASGDAEGNVVLWDVGTAAELRRLPHEQRIEALAFRDDAETLLVVEASGKATVHDLAGGRVAYESPAAPGFVFRGLASPDGERHGWVGDAGTVRVWSTIDGARLSALRLRAAGQVESAALPSRSPHLALVSNTTAAVVLDLEHNESPARVFDHEFGYRTVALSRDGSRLATGSGGGTVQVHHAGTGTLLYTLSAGTDAVLAVAFSPDGTRLGFADNRGSIKIW